jgi:ectoine hydrolase
MVEPVLHFGRDEYARRLARTRAAMEAAGIEVLVVTDASNMAWLTGYDGWSFYTPQAVVVAGGGEPVWWGRGMDVAGALRTCWMAEENLLGFADRYVHSRERHAMEDLADRIAERGWGRARIGVEMDNWWLSAASFAELQRGLPEARFRDATGLVNWQRAVKSEAELAHMRTAARIVERMHARILEVAEPGLRKCDLAAEIWGAALRYDEAIGAGGDYPAIVPMMPSGADAAAPHLTWDDRPLKAGEGTFFELAGVSHRYHCPLARTLFLGKPTRTFLDAEATVLEGMEAGLAAAVPGNRVEDIATAFLAVLERRMGIRKESRTGYSIGLSYPPDWGERTMSIRPGERTPLEPGMTFHFMTGLWMADWGFEITESIVIREGPAECLANVPRKLFVKD